MKLLSVLLTLTGGAVAINPFSSLDYIRPTSPDIITELGSRLSPNASILFPSSPEFANATSRWQDWQEPNITVVVEVATESDVQETIKYANYHGIDFLARGGGHGAISSLGNVHHGIEIWLHQLNTIAISGSGDYARIGGGVLSGDVVHYLWPFGKQAVTGACECTGILGPLLGGGHGVLQGEYGLLVDNILSARVVLADGTAVTASETENPDLFWGLRGAGHNFGVVTEFTYKIYDVPANDSWQYEIHVFKGDQLEGLYSADNSLSANKERRKNLALFSIWTWNKAVDSEAPVIIFFVFYHGSSANAQQFFAPFRNLTSTVPVQSGTTTLPEIASLTGQGFDNAACAHGGVNLKFPVGLKTYNIQAQRNVYNTFKQVTTSTPGLQPSSFLFEGYPVAAVQDVPENATAFPHRVDNLLVTPQMVYSVNATLDPIAIKAGKQMRDILHNTSGSPELHAYVNYAHGDEGLQEIYGYENWRLQKLRGLKRTYDPEGRFDFYAPIS